MHEFDLSGENSTCSMTELIYYMDLRPQDLALVYNSLTFMNDKI